MTTTRAAIRAALGYGPASCLAMMAATGAMAQDGTVRTAAARDLPSDAGAQSKAPTSDAQTGDSLGEILVTGIRASLTTARAIKRDSQGIVDAIAPEDIGKLPDTNLAESLQRITGVSIDRSGGEGEFITIRGFGPAFNAVLLNGRQMATATDPTQASGRAFSCDVLASELVSGVQVYKSSTARLQSGGVGSTVNIKTARPFAYPASKSSGSTDMNHDEIRASLRLTPRSWSATCSPTEHSARWFRAAIKNGTTSSRRRPRTAGSSTAARRLRRSTAAPGWQKPRAIPRVICLFLKISAARSSSKPASALAVRWSCSTSQTRI